MARSVYYDPFGMRVAGHQAGIADESKLQSDTRQARASDYAYNNFAPLQLEAMQGALYDSDVTRLTGLGMRSGRFQPLENRDLARYAPDSFSFGVPPARGGTYAGPGAGGAPSGIPGMPQAQPDAVQPATPGPFYPEQPAPPTPLSTYNFTDQLVRRAQQLGLKPDSLEFRDFVTQGLDARGERGPLGQQIPVAQQGTSDAPTALAPMSWDDYMTRANAIAQQSGYQIGSPEHIQFITQMAQARPAPISPGYAPAPLPGQAPAGGYAPAVAGGYDPQGGAAPAAGGYAPQPVYDPTTGSYAPAPASYAPQGGYAPAPAGYDPTTGSYAPTQGYAPQGEVPIYGDVNPVTGRTVQTYGMPNSYHDWALYDQAVKQAELRQRQQAIDTQNQYMVQKLYGKDAAAAAADDGQYYMGGFEQ